MVGSNILDVSAWEIDTVEAGGSGGDVWLRDAQGTAWLYEPNRVMRGDHEAGEDWAEVLAHHMAGLLGVPSALVEMADRVSADRGTSHGVVSRSIIPNGHELHAGGVLLTDSPGYHLHRLDDSGRAPRDHVGHDLGNVHDVLKDVHPPVGLVNEDLSAFDVFTGYLVLDAWIANQDRHEENWAVLREPGGSMQLAASFDHGASLGHQLLDADRVERCLSGRVLGWASAGRATKFEGRKTSLVDLAAEGLRRARPAAREHWLSRLAAVKPTDYMAEVAATPRMSEAARSFCIELLRINQERLINDCQ